MSGIFFNKTIKRNWDWLSVVLLILVMEIAAARLVATLWTLDLNLILLVTFLGTVLGLTLGSSTYRRFWVIILAAVYGAILIAWQLGLTLESDLRWRDRLINLWGRLDIVINELVTKKPVTDNLLFLLLMATLFWVVAVYAGFVLVREANPWKVVIPAGIVAFVINSFDALLLVRSLYLAVYLLFALFLVARLVYIKNFTKWNERHTHTPPDLGFELSRVALAISIILVFFAWNIPVVTDTLTPVADLWQTTSKPWLTLKDRLSFMFASLEASAASVQNFYGSTLPLGLGSPLSDQIVMEVQAPTNAPGGSRYYWEARTYDTYNNFMWTSTIQTPHNLNLNSKDLNQPGVDVRTVVPITFLPHQPISNIYTASEALWTSVPTQALMRVNPDGTVNLSALMSTNFIRPGEQYTVRSALDTVTVKQLKDAGVDYPAWVTDEYLQLPDNITLRTKDLAKNIATGFTNPYDIADAVTQYLRANIQYDLSISQPPTKQDRIDWFLFDYKRGFCNYYATAEVILLRSLGIPARMSVGFVQGQREDSTPTQVSAGASQEIIQTQLGEIATFVVRQNNAHAWPEVYFPGIGWVIFEPTASQSALSRPLGEDASSYGLIESGRGHPTPIPREELGSGPQLPGSSSKSGGPNSFWTTTNIVLFILVQIFIGAMIIIAWQFLRGFRVYSFLERISVQVPETIEKGLRRFGISPPNFLVSWIYYMKLPSTSRAYMEINNALDRIGKKPEIYATPTERTNLLISTSPVSAVPARDLLTEYQKLVYSTERANPEIAKISAAEIRKISWREWVRKYTKRFKIPGRNKSE
jgi:transglutaminase-like putative cysteine protease